MKKKRILAETFMPMRYDRWLAGIALLLGGLVWGQVTPWPLSKWQLYAVQNGQPTGAPLPERSLVYFLDTFASVVDTMGMAAAGITGWRWTVFPLWNAMGFNPTFSTAETLIFTPSIQSAYPNPPPVVVALQVTGPAGDTAQSYRLLQLRRNWGGVGDIYFWACPGGEAYIPIDMTTTDVDSVKVWIERGGVRYDSITVTRPTVWRFSVPAVTDTYDVIGIKYLRGRPWAPDGPYFYGTLYVQPRYPFLGGACVLQPMGAYCVGDPVELYVDLYGELRAQVGWDFDGNGTVDATGPIGRTTFSAPGTYTIQAYVSWLPGCRETLQTSVTIEPTTALTAPAILGPSTYVLGQPVRLRLGGTRGTVYVDWLNDGQWEGIATTTTGFPFLTPSYTLSSPPPAGGYPVRVRQVLCGSSREDVLYWSPTLSSTLTPDGVILLKKRPFCVGDSVVLAVQPSANFSPGQAGYLVAWNFGGGWTAPSVTAAETVFTWNGQPLAVRAQLYHPSGGNRIIGPLSVTALARWGGINRFTDIDFAPGGCTADWCPTYWVWGDVLCGGRNVRISLTTQPQGRSWRWRLLLPTDTLSWPADSVPSTYTYTLPMTPGVYTIESQLETPCGLWQEVWAFRVENTGTGRPGAVMYTQTTCNYWYTTSPEVKLVVCAREQVYVYDYDAREYGGGGIEELRIVYANGQPVETAPTGGGISFVAPAQPGSYTVYLLWRSCGGREDTLTYRLEVKESQAPYFTAPRMACVGQPVTFHREGPTPLQGHPAWLQWDFGDGTLLSDTATVLTHTYSQPGYYTVKLDGVNPACGRRSFSRQIHVASSVPTPTILSASLVNGVLTFAGEAPGADSVVWHFGDGNIAVGVLAGTHTYAGNGPYTVHLYAYNGCGVDTAQVVVTTLAQQTPAGWRLYPNPATQELYVEAPAGSFGEVAFYTVTGQLIRRYLLAQGAATLAVGDLPRGLYIVQLRSAQGLSYARVVLE